MPKLKPWAQKEVSWTLKVGARMLADWVALPIVTLAVVGTKSVWSPGRARLEKYRKV